MFDFGPSAALRTVYYSDRRIALLFAATAANPDFFAQQLLVIAKPTGRTLSD